MRNSSKDLSVFEFKADEANEAGDKLSKYHFLEAFASGYQHLKIPNVSDLPPIDFHEVDSPEKSTGNLVSAEDISGLDDIKACSTSYSLTKTYTSDFRPVSIVHEDGFEMGAPRILMASACDDEDSVLHSSDLPVNLVSNEEESCTSTSETSSTSGDLTGPDGHTKCVVLEHWHSTFDEDDNKNAVAVCPDYVIYRNKFFLESQLTFCSDCIKIECSDTCGSDEKLILVCDIADVIRIGCQWSTSVDAVLFKFWIRTNVGPDPEKFEASVSIVFWSEKELQIKSLAERYKDIWDTLPDNSFALEDKMFRVHMSFSKQYFTNTMEPFEDVIYPKGDPDAVSISRRDVELLEPDTFINDTIIDFYIKYLQDNVQPTEKSRFHFFNCFFFRKLADLDKDPGSISEGRAAYQRVRKWTRKLNIFEKDYIFIPVNFNLHWSLLVVCHPGEIVTFEDDIKNSPKVPCILHMDSFKGSHKGLEKLIQSYLLEEWKGRHSEFLGDITSRFSNLRFVHLELPQQENSSDCGLFLLHYVELFLDEAPISFNPTKITNLSNFLSSDWFPPSEASLKRFHIRGLLYDLLRDSSQKPASSNEDFPSSDNVDNDVDQAVEFLSARASPSIPCEKNEDIVWRELLHPGSSSILPPAAQDDIFDQTASFMSSPVTCPLEVHGDSNAEYLEKEVEADSEERVVPICNPTVLIYSTSSYGIPSISEEVKEAVVDTLSTSSNGEQVNSNERCEARELTTPTIVDCTFVPDTPDIFNQQLEDYGKNSQGVDTSNVVEVEEHVDPPVPCTSDEDHFVGNENSLETCPTDDTETTHGEVHEKTNMSETGNRKAEHCPEGDETGGGCCKFREGYLIEDLDGEDKEMSCYEKVEVADSQENMVIKEISQEDLLCPRDAVTTEVILSDNDVTPPKRNKISWTMLQTPKRQKLEQHNARVTRSSSRKTGA